MSLEQFIQVVKGCELYGTVVSRCRQHTLDKSYIGS